MSPPKPGPDPKGKPEENGTAAAGAAAGAGGKAKSAKELKKEKRAAAVAARGAEGAGAGAEGSRPQTISAGSAITDSTHSTPHSPALSQQITSGGAGPSAPRRPAHYSEPSAMTISTVQQNLFFSHLPRQVPPSTSQALESTKLHPLVIRLGVLMSSGKLRGANARTIGMMSAFREVIRDYECPDQAVLWKDLPVYLSPMIAWLENCRPKGVGGGNAIRWLKSEINRLGEQGTGTESEQKEYLIEAIGLYIRDRIDFAGQVIADIAKEKIKPGDTVVTYARSSVVERVLLEAWRDMRQDDPDASFKVVVVDSRPLLEGQHLLDALTTAGLQCSYIVLPVLSSVLPQADLVLLGGSALHSDGALYSRAGTAIVAMLAKEHRVPVVACVETYKFGERVVLDAVASNELGDTAGLLSLPINKKFAMKNGGTAKDVPPNLTPLNLVYDLTPPTHITAVCTEIGFIPPSSVPTVLGGKGSAL